MSGGTCDRTSDIACEEFLGTKKMEKVRCTYNSQEKYRRSVV